MWIRFLYVHTPHCLFQLYIQAVKHLKQLEAALHFLSARVDTAAHGRAARALRLCVNMCHFTQPRVSLPDKTETMCASDTVGFCNGDTEWEELKKPDIYFISSLLTFT